VSTYKRSAIAGAPVAKRTISRRQKQAYLAIDDAAVLCDSGGALAHYGFADLKTGVQVLDNLSFLHGLVPLEGSDYSHLPSTTIGRCPNAALHLFRRDELNWVVVLDPASAGDDSIHTLKIEKVRDDLLDKFLGREMAERVSQGVDSISDQGERREVSVLFADLRGFTAFCDSNSTVDIFPLLNQLFGAMIKPVLDNEGIVDKIIGDAVMAVFGLGSDEGPDHKRRAIETGIEMIARIGERTGGQQNPSSVAGLGVGIASGDVVVGGLGDDRRRSLTVIGHRVNLAARLEGQARPGELLIDVTTWEGMSSGQELFSLTDLWLKGLTRPVPAMSYFPGATNAAVTDAETG
jgi:class 3 adenylate cyclase